MREKMMFNSDASQLTVLQLQALIFINKEKTISISDIAKQFKVSLPTATVFSDKLVKMNIIKRKKTKTDRRIVNISLTEKGENLLKKAMKQRHQKVSKLLSYLSTKDKMQLLSILKNLSGKIQKTYEK
jgi:MarR family transcriptional regulator, organic hydroperoxide resistance regulator